MFQRLSVSGVNGAVVRGYRTAARLKTWSARKNANGTWSLSGEASEVDAFLVRQAPLLFHAPSPGTSWPVESIRVENKRVVALLGKPEKG